MPVAEPTDRERRLAAALNALDVGVMHPDMGGHHQCTVRSAYTSLDPETWAAIHEARAMAKPDEPGPDTQWQIRLRDGNQIYGTYSWMDGGTGTEPDWTVADDSDSPEDFEAVEMLPLVIVAHPERQRKQLEALIKGVDLPQGILVIPPTSYIN